MSTTVPAAPIPATIAGRSSQLVYVTATMLVTRAALITSGRAKSKSINALAWLRAARALGVTLPLNTTQRFCAVRGLVEALGWPTWKQDVTRHSAATYMLATSESAAAVANTLGNSESILRRHYLALVTRPQAEAFWAVPPPAVPATASPSATSARTSP